MVHSVTEQNERDARDILAWMLDPSMRPFTDELQQAACRCAAAILRISKSSMSTSPADQSKTA